MNDKIKFGLFKQLWPHEFPQMAFSFYLFFLQGKKIHITLSIMLMMAYVI